MTEKVRVHEIAKELGIASKDVLEKAKKMGLEVKSAQSVVTMEQAETIANYIINGEPAETSAKAEPKKVKKESKKSKSDTPKEEAPAPKETEKVEEKAEEKPVETPKAKVATEEEPQTTKEPKEESTAKEQEEKTEEKKPKSSLKVVQPSVRPAIKKSGLKIVKKKKPKVEESYSTPAKSKTLSSYGKMSQEALEELARKKKSVKKEAPVAKKDQGVKLDIFGGSLAEVSMDMDDQVTLLDLNVTERAPIVEEQKKPRAPKPVGRNANKKQAPRGRKVSRDKRKKYTKEKHVDEVVTHVEIPEDIRVYEFAEKLKRPMSDIIKVLFDLGMMMTKNDFLGSDEIEILSEEFGVEVTVVDPKDEFNYVSEEKVDEDPDAQERPPVITIMDMLTTVKLLFLTLLEKQRSQREKLVASHNTSVHTQ